MTLDDPVETLALTLEDTWIPLERFANSLVEPVELGEAARAAAKVYDYDATQHPAFTPWRMPASLPATWSIGAIVGGSGTGKTTLLREFGEQNEPQWDAAKCIADHFVDPATRFYAVGLSSVPTWLKPYHVLSNGERFRADLAASLEDGALIDEFTSVVDRIVAKAASRSFGKHVRQAGLSRIVVSTVHRDVLPWLEPDWIIDTDAGMWALRPRECLQRSPMVAHVHEVTRELWRYFMEHHYLSNELSFGARCYLATVEDVPAAFAAAITLPSGTIPNAWRATRLVTLPDFQGLGIGPRLADWVAELYTDAGFSYYAKTTHPRLGEYRERHPNWMPTTQNRKTARINHARLDRWSASERLSYSHKYVLNTPTRSIAK